MTSESTTTGETTTRTRRTNGSDTSMDGGGLAGAVHEVRGALEGVSRSVPDAARASRAVATDLFHAIEKGSDERVSAGVTLSLGLAIGMLIGGAPRLLIALALAPLVAMGLVMADRRPKAGRAAA